MCVCGKKKQHKKIQTRMMDGDNDGRSVLQTDRGKSELRFFNYRRLLTRGDPLPSYVVVTHESWIQGG